MSPPARVPHALGACAALLLLACAGGVRVEDEDGAQPADPPEGEKEDAALDAQDAETYTLKCGGEGPEPSLLQRAAEPARLPPAPPRELTEPQEIASALLGLNASSTLGAGGGYYDYKCDGQELQAFKSRFGAKSSACEDTRHAELRDRPPCHEGNVLFLYPWSDHNDAFCVNSNVCHRMSNWAENACSVYLHRATSVRDGTARLDEFADNSLKHVVLGGHGSGWSLHWGDGRECGSSHLCVDDHESTAFVEKLGRKMHRHASLFLDSCKSATEASSKKRGGQSLAEWFAGILGKGIRVIGSKLSFGKVKVQRFMAWHARIDGQDDGAAEKDVQRVYFADGGECPPGSRSPRPDGDGNCACPEGATCKTLDGGACPRSRGQVSDAFFLPMCFEGWAKVRCQCSAYGGGVTQGQLDAARDKRGAFIGAGSRESPRQFVTQQAFGGGEAFVALHAVPSWTAQEERRAAWPELRAWVAEKQGAGLELMSLRYGLSGLWSGVVARGSCVSGSGWVSESSLERVQAAIRDVWGQGKKVLDVSYGDGTWKLVAGRCDEMPGEQKLEVAAKWKPISDFVKQGWKERYFITSVARGPSYLVVTTQNPTFKAQSYDWRSKANVQEFIDLHLGKEKVITSLVDDYDHDPDRRYLVVMSKVRMSNLFPTSGAAHSYERALPV